MDINGITSLSALPGVSSTSVPSVNNGDLSASSSSVSGSSINQNPASQSQMPSAINNADYIKKQLSAIFTTYPPWFPAGSPQRIDTIKAVKSVLDSAINSSVSADTKKQLSGIQLTDNATDTEMAAALHAVSQCTSSTISSGTTVSGGEQPGAVINVNV